MSKFVFVHPDYCSDIMAIIYKICAKGGWNMEPLKYLSSAYLYRKEFEIMVVLYARCPM